MEGISMKKSGIIVGFLATAFGLAVVNKMHKMNTNKDSVNLNNSYFLIETV